ncbi:uncharacterized protein LOC106772423 isoform X3 [Vigna radiata var. radiata]|uniref:Uncharacterized protein LOC106772423 isoform X3 n=1 Tax=Vigna radiata var. radiata TaxID=3916 RepID=A0A3Q0FAW5_VIGRR|nr:uncharacterized protein LOC106772423 isoform X3 [Vigna radiata var. radiata]
MRSMPSPVQEHLYLPQRERKLFSTAVPGDDMDDASPCLLYILDDTEIVLVARGIMFKAATVVHDMVLSEDEVKVSVDEMIIPDAEVPLSTYEIFTVEQAFKSFIAWPKHLIGSVFDPLTQAQEKIPLSQDDPLGSLQLLADILQDKPLEVEYYSNVFGRVSEVPLYLHSSDVKELASGTQELNITIIQLWMMHHWQLLVISMHESYALWFCSLHRPPPTNLRQLVDFVTNKVGHMSADTM